MSDHIIPRFDDRRGDLGGQPYTVRVSYMSQLRFSGSKTAKKINYGSYEHQDCFGYVVPFGMFIL